MEQISNFGIENLRFASPGGLLLVAGPCVVESAGVCEEVAGRLVEITGKLGMPFIFKASYRKANRSRGDSFRGLGDDEALEVLASIRNRFKVPVLTDVHESHEVARVSEVADILQIPAFLIRQTMLIEAAAATGKPLNLKKAQFLAPASMRFAVDKALAMGNRRLMLTERGTQFGYGDLVVDFRSIPEMQSLGFPVLLDVTHSLQRPNQAEGVSGGQPALIELMARAGVAAGVNGLFLETHPDPSRALSDGSNMLPLDLAEKLLERIAILHETVTRLCS